MNGWMRALLATTVAGLVSGCGSTDATWEPAPDTGGDARRAALPVVHGDVASGPLGQGEWADYYLDVPADATGFEFQLNGVGDMDLYLMYGARPTNSVFDVARTDSGSWALIAVNETTTTPRFRTGRWYVSVHAYTSGQFGLRVWVDVVPGGGGGGGGTGPTAIEVCADASGTQDLIYAIELKLPGDVPRDSFLTSLRDGECETFTTWPDTYTVYVHWYDPWGAPTVRKVHPGVVVRPGETTTLVSRR